MRRALSRFIVLCFFVSSAHTIAAQADVPQVAADIAPVHGLVARVMDGVGTPHLVMKQGASPHDYALRPSDARALEQADIVFWTGPELAPWLDGMVRAVATDALSVPLLHSGGTFLLDFRTGALFEGHDHDAGHDDEGQGDAGQGDEGADDDHDAHAHDGAGIDPHAWLDPQNAQVWLDVIAETLSAADPENAALYRRNADAGRAEIAAMTAQIAADLDAVREARFIVFHDAFHYFENRFGLSAMGAISLGDGAAPSPARIKELRDGVRAHGADCVFSEPQFNAGLVKTLLEGSDADLIVIDPLGVGLPIGPTFYPALLQEVAAGFAACR